MTGEILFKYRSIQNWKFILDIFLNKRLYAATYKELNDPMEGRYYYHNDAVSREYKRIIRNKKLRWRICSLSRTHINTLMWSYYSDAHHGIAVGVTVKKPRDGSYIKRPVQYDMEVNASGIHDPSHAALEILSQKQLAWQHEDEERVFTKDQFVSVTIKKVCFGYKTEPADKELIKALVKKTSPNVQFVELKRGDFDMPPDGI